MKKLKVLVVVDMQNDFVSGSLGSEDAKAIVPNVMEKINNFDGEYIIFTRDTHTDDYLYTKEGEKLPVVHCVRGSEGWRLIPEIEEWLHKNLMTREKTVMVVDKPTFGSVYSGNETKSLVECVSDIVKTNGDPKEFDIEACGLITDICVLHNAIILKSFFYDNSNIVIDSSCCAGSTPENHQKALDIMGIGHITIK